MASVPRQDRNRALNAAAFWCLSRARDRELDQSVVENLGFGSVEAMRKQLENWGLPEWLLEEPSKSKARVVQEPLGERKRRAKKVRGEKQKLPPAKGAAHLFKAALDKLYDAVEFLESDYREKSGTRYSEEYLQNGRFFQYVREVTHWTVPDLGRTGFTAARQSPGHGVTELIAVYLLIGGDPELLIEKLHPYPDELDRTELRRVLYGDKNNSKPGLRLRAVHAARLIRGADLKRGSGPADLSVDEQMIRWRIVQGRREGRSDKEIIEVLAKEGTTITQAELQRLAEFDPPEPNTS
jgi:hypothetical protein